MIPADDIDTLEERAPLLPRSRKPWQCARGTRHFLTRALGPVTLVFTKNTIKTALTFLAAILVSLSSVGEQWLEGSAYLLAMAVLYFHPARTVGAMVEALFCSVIGLGVGYAIAKGCTAVAVIYQEDEKNEIEAHAIAMSVLFVVTFVVAFIRAKYNVSRPAIGTACTLTHLLTFLSITKISSDESLHELPAKINRTAAALLCGTLISCLGCCVIRPQTASSVIREQMSEGFYNLRKFFGTLSQTFSLISEAAPIPAQDPNALHLQIEQDLRPIRRQDSDSSLLPDANLEATHAALGDLLETNRAMLLRLATSRDSIVFEPVTSLSTHRKTWVPIFTSFERLSQHLAGLQTSITKVDKIIMQDADNAVLVEFITNMGGSLRQLVVICKQSLALLENLFAAPVQNAHDAEVLLPALKNLFEQLGAALDAFDENQRTVLLKLLHNVHEDVFLMFFFVFELMEFVKELMRLVSAIEVLKRDVIERRRMGRLRWLLRSISFGQATDPVPGAAATTLLQQRRARKPLPGSVRRERLSRAITVANLDFGCDGHRPKRDGWGELAWKAFIEISGFEGRFAFKTAMTVALLSLPAFLDVTEDIFQDFRMHWALNTFVMVMTPSVGGTNVAGFWRLLGTFAGAAAAVLAGTLFPGNPIGLFCAAAVFCFPAAYMWLETRYPLMGQVSLISFTIIIFNDFSGAIDPETGEWYSILSVALRRGAAVASGCLVGMLVSRFVWPFTARKALRLGLADAILDIGILYARLAGLFVSEREIGRADQAEFMEDEMELRMELARLGALMKDAEHEPRLRGRFPVEKYARIVRGCEQILNQFVSMRAGMTSSGFDHVRASFVKPVRSQRAQMISEILLYFHLISGALILRRPLPPRFPDARAARAALVAAIRALPIMEPRAVGKAKDPAAYYYCAFVSSMDDIVSELEALGEVCVELFGRVVIGQWEWENDWRSAWGDGD
ncbi:Fusaric acid resistance protein-like-domain-containing protein [Geranomyces variabilis]|nr:Fusaric acid resistance protein-like-domain-containing protein [Geranomyces variabilis]KAJ3143437.1 hypothetical protein HDU90_000197 [Geranomyces variabilis]